MNGTAGTRAGARPSAPTFDAPSGGISYWLTGRRGRGRALDRAPLRSARYLAACGTDSRDAGTRAGARPSAPTFGSLFGGMSYWFSRTWRWTRCGRSTGRAGWRLVWYLFRRGEWAGIFAGLIYMTKGLAGWGESFYGGMGDSYLRAA